MLQTNQNLVKENEFQFRALLKNFSGFNAITMVKNESLVVFLASCKSLLSAPFFLTFARLHASSVKKHIMQTQWRSSDSLSGFSRSVAVIKLHAAVIASASFKTFFPLDFERFERIRSEYERNGLSPRAKKVTQLQLYWF